jgi:hypothetical protein
MRDTFVRLTDLEPEPLPRFIFVFIGSNS